MRHTPALVVHAGLALAALVLAAPALAARVEGDGRKVTEARTLPPFSRVELRAALDLEVTEGPPQAVSVTLDGNLLPLLETRVEGDALVIDSRQELRWRGEGKARLSVPVLRGLSIAGSGDVAIAGADATRDLRLSVSGSGNLRWSGKAGALEVAVAGSGDVRLSGSAARLSVSVTGSGDVDAERLAAGSASLTVSGSGDLKARLEGGPLSAAVNGSGSITWWGSARPESVVVNGSGSVTHHR